MAPLLRKFLRAYKPFDAQLRKLPAYARLSRSLQKRYSAAVTDRSNKKEGGLRADAQIYIDKFDEIQPRQDTILFECYWGQKFADNPLAMYRRLVKDYPQGTFRIYWVAKEPELAPAETSKNPDVTFVVPGTLDYGIALLTAGYLVNNVTFGPFFIRRPGQRYCNTWHGVPMKAMGRDMVAPLMSMANSQRNFLQSDVLLEMGEFYHWATIRPYYVEQLAAESLLPCGAPRTDDVITPKVPADEIRARYGILPTQTVVLFAPTWRGNSTAVHKGAAVDQGILYGQMADALGDGYFVLFSAHQMVKVPSAGNRTNGATLSDSDNINDIITIVDIMVSDYSSIIFDFLPVDRPIVLFTPDIEDYRKSRGLYLAPEELPCANTTSFAEMIAAIKAARKPSSFAGYPAMRDKFVPLEDGQASAKALTALLAPANPPHRKADGRKRILIAPGGMIPNGITSSLKNLIANLDYDRFDPYILLDAAVMDKDEKRIEQIGEFDPRCNWILRCGDMLMTAEEVVAYRAFRVGDQLDGDKDLAVIRGLFEREALRVLGDKHFDLAIEFAGYSPYWAALIACCSADRKVCYQHNHLWAEYSNPDPKRNQRQLLSVFQIYKWFDQIVAVSDETRRVNEEHLSSYYPPDSVALTVRNTMNARRVVERARQPVVLAHPEAGALFHDPDVFRFIALGRLSPEKRYDRMIGALARIAPVYPNAVLMICGSGPLQESLTKLAKRLGVATQVRFLGQVSNPYPLLARADICVMSSDYEGQPMALLEALSLGITCIGTDIPGIRSVLKDGLGHIVAPTEEAMAKAMSAAVEGVLPKIRAADIAGSYVKETMDEFTSIVCARPD